MNEWHAFYIVLQFLSYIFFVTAALDFIYIYILSNATKQYLHEYLSLCCVWFVTMTVCVCIYFSLSSLIFYLMLSLSLSILFLFLFPVLPLTIYSISFFLRILSNNGPIPLWPLFNWSYIFFVLQTHVENHYFFFFLLNKHILNETAELFIRTHFCVSKTRTYTVRSEMLFISYFDAYWNIFFLKKHFGLIYMECGAHTQAQIKWLCADNFFFWFWTMTIAQSNQQ